MSAYEERFRIAAEIAANAEKEALMNADERLELARQRRNRLIAGAFDHLPGASVTVEIGDETVEIVIPSKVGL